MQSGEFDLLNSEEVGALDVLNFVARKQNRTCWALELGSEANMLSVGIRGQ